MAIMMNAFRSVFPTLAMAFMVFILPAYAQTTTTSFPCTSAMLTSFTPCMNFLTNGNGNSSTPTAACCTSLKSLVSNGTGCLCQIVMGGVPFKIPINRTLAVSLPKACNQPGVPVQCKVSAGAPVPAPGPAAFLSPSASPGAAISPSSSAGTVPTVETPALSPISETTPGLTPPSTTTGTSSTLTPSAAGNSLSVSPLLVIFSVAIIIMKQF